MIGLIRVVTLESFDDINKHAEIIKRMFGLEIKSACIPEQYSGIHDEESEQLAIPKIIELGKQFKEEGCSALIVSCAADPAIDQLRNSTGLTVIGAGSSAALVARATGKQTGVIGITDEAPAVVKENLGQLFAGYLKPEGINNTNDLLTPLGQKNCIAAVKKLLQDGAQQIQFACTGMGTINLKRLLEKVVDVPIVDAVEAEGLFASFYVDSEQNTSSGGK